MFLFNIFVLKGFSRVPPGLHSSENLRLMVSPREPQKGALLGVFGTNQKTRHEKQQM